MKEPHISFVLARIDLLDVRLRRMEAVLARIGWRFDASEGYTMKEWLQDVIAEWPEYTLDPFKADKAFAEEGHQKRLDLHRRLEEEARDAEK